MKRNILIFVVLLISCVNITYAQTVVWSEDFTSGAGNWDLNLNGASVISGSTPTDQTVGNAWIVNDSYTALLTGGGNITLNPAPSGGGNYLHIHCNDNNCQLLLNFIYYNGPDFNANNSTNKVARLKNPIPGTTLSGGPYTLVFEWMCQGEPGSAFAKLVYSINGGPWQEYSQEFSGMGSTWQTANINLSTLGWNPGNSFQFGFRWRNEANGLGQEPSFSVDNIRITTATSSNTITTSSITPTTYCAGQNISVNFTSTGTFNPGNIYSLQMSDAGGNFATPTVIGTLASTANSGTINGTIPASTTPGTGYRFRVIASNPNTIGSDNGQNIEILPAFTPDVTITGTSNTACAGVNITFTANVTGAGNATVNYQWFINNIPLGGNTPNFTTNTLQPGNTVKVIITATSNCGTVTDTSNTIVMQGITASCSTNTNTVFITVNGGTPPYKFKVIDFGDGTSDSLMNVSSTTASFNHTYSTTGTFNVQVSVTDSSGCTAFSNCTLNNSTTSSVTEIYSSYAIYPNPFHQQLHIRWFNSSIYPEKITILDMLGKKVLETPWKGNEELIVDTQELMNGVYILQIHNHSQILSTKIIK